MQKVIGVIMRGYLKVSFAFIMSIAMLLGSANVMADSGQFKLDMMLAKRGDPDAQYYVGMGYEEGRGTKKDMKKAYEWYSKSAEQGHYGAQYKVGVFHEYGYGVKKDIKTAFEWYKKSAENGSTMAKERLNKAAFAKSEQVLKRRIAAMKEEQEQADRKRQQAAKAKREAEAKRKREMAAKKAQATKVAKIEPKPAKKAARADIPDIMDVVLKNKWTNQGYPADYLPSSITNCLKASDKEVICFSREMARTVKGAKVTYTTKATLTGFSRNGSFKVKYHYNAMDIAPSGDAGPSVDPLGLRAEQGWQEPQLAMNCQTTDRVNMVCSRGKVKVRYQR